MTTLPLLSEGAQNGKMGWVGGWGRWGTKNSQRQYRVLDQTPQINTLIENAKAAYIKVLSPKAHTTPTLIPS